MSWSKRGSSYRSLSGDDPAFPDQFTDYIEDRVRARIHQVETTTSGSSVLGAGARPGSMQLVLGGAAVGVTALTGAPIATAAAVGGGSTIINALCRMIFHPRQQGANLVISALTRR